MSYQCAVTAKRPLSQPGKNTPSARNRHRQRKLIIPVFSRLFPPFSRLQLAFFPSSTRLHALQLPPEMEEQQHEYSTSRKCCQRQLFQRVRPSHAPSRLQCRTDEKRQQSTCSIHLERIH